MAEGEKQVVQDVPAAPSRPFSFLTRAAARITGDQLSTSESITETGFPWTFADATQRPIGSMFKSTASITDDDLNDMYNRYQLARRIVDDPVEDAFADGISFRKLNGKEVDPETEAAANKVWREYETKWNRFFKLTRLKGRCEMIYGWNDPRENWADTPPPDGATFNWLQPVPTDYEVELKESETIPVKIEYLTVNFGSDTIKLHRSRFTHAMNPKLIEEDKEGISVLMPIYNLLNVQIHADWSIGQALFRRASGLLGIFAPKGNISDTQRSGAVGSVSNHNSKTALYVPFGWNIKDILKPGGNLAIARTYRVILEQMAAGSGFPVSVLIGQQKSSLSMSEEDMTIYQKTVRNFKENTMQPTLQKFFRIAQIAGKIPPGELVVVPNMPIYKDLYQEEKEETIMGAMRLLQARMDHAADEKGNIVEPFATGLPENQELIKLIGTFKDTTKKK